MDRLARAGQEFQDHMCRCCQAEVGADTPVYVDVDLVNDVPVARILCEPCHDYSVPRERKARENGVKDGRQATYLRAMNVARMLGAHTVANALMVEFKGLVEVRHGRP